VGDVKDETVSDVLASELTYKDAQDVFFRGAQNLFRKEPVDVIACTGDLGQGAYPETLRLGVLYLAKLADKLGVKREKVIVAPGNHDLCRDADAGEELSEFIRACRKAGFKCAERTKPACLSIKGVPMVALNTCLGGTEHAFHGLPDSFWNAAVSSVRQMELLGRDTTMGLPADLRAQLEAMDIPAIGWSQLDSMLRHLNKAKANCAVVVAHHSPTPTPNIEVRPYGLLVDSGPFIFGLMEGGRRVLLLHGHAHCDSALTAQTPQAPEPGFIATIGSRGLHGNGGAKVSHVQLLITEDRNFLMAVVSRFEQQGSAFHRMESFYIWDSPGSAVQVELDLDKLDRNHQYLFSEIANALGVPGDESLADRLLRLSNRRQLSVTNITNSHKKWIVTRIG